MNITKKIRKITLGILGTAILASGFWACSDDASLNNETTSSSYNITAEKISNEKRLSLTELETLGKNHNKLIIDAFENIQSKGIELNKENLINEFKSINIDLSSINTNVDRIVNNSIKNSHLSLTDIKLDKEIFTDFTHDYLNDVNEAITEDYIQTMNNLEFLKNKIISDENINANDFNLLIGTIEVAKNSAELWMNSPITQNFKTSSANPPKKNIIRADAAASSAYFIGIGVAGAVGLGTPVTAAAVLGGWAISAGIGSAYHYIGLE